MSRELKSREKKVQKMSKDGLVELNAVTGDERSISGRERDFDLRKDKTGGEIGQLNGRSRSRRKRDRKAARKSRKNLRNRQFEQPQEIRAETRINAEDTPVREETAQSAQSEQRLSLIEPPIRKTSAETSQRESANISQKSPQNSAKPPPDTTPAEQSERQNPLKFSEAEQSAETDGGIIPTETKPEQPAEPAKSVKPAKSGRIRFNRNTKLNQISSRSKRSKQSKQSKSKNNGGKSNRKKQSQKFKFQKNLPKNQNVSDIPETQNAEENKTSSETAVAERENNAPETPDLPEKSSKLQFTDGEKPPEKSDVPDVPADIADKSDGKLTRLKNKADKYGSELEKAKSKLPSKKRLKITQAVDEKSGKPAMKLRFEDEILPQNSQTKIPPTVSAVKGAAVTAARFGSRNFHKKIYEAEDENVGIKSAHRIEQAGEAAYRRGKSAGRSALRYVKNAPYRKVEKLEQKSKSATLKYNVQKSKAENPQFKSNVLSRFMQKQKIKKDYAKAAREAKKAGETVKKTGDITAKTTKAVAGAVKRHPIAAAVLAVVLLLVFFFTSMCSAFGSMAGGGFSAFAGAFYAATDEDLTQAELYYTELETDYATANSVTLTHDPYELAAFLTAVYGEFKFDDIKEILSGIFERQTDEAKSFTEVIAELMNDSQRGIYEALIYSGGNRQIVSSPLGFDWLPSVTSYFGWRISPISGVKQWHRGLDIAAPTGTEIYAANSGVVTVAGWDNSYGNYIVVRSADGIETKYAHCSELLAAVGDEVKQGGIIALVGSTGDSTDAHLHFELLKNGEYLNAIYFTWRN